MPRKKKRGKQNKLNNIFYRLSYLPKTFSLLWAASPKLTVAWLILLIIQGVLPGFSVYLTRNLVNTLVTVVGAGITSENIRIIIIPVLLIAGILVLTECLRSINEFVRSAQSEFLQDYISGLIHGQSVSIDYGCYESSEYNDRLARAREGASNRCLSLLDSSGSLLQNSITLLTMGAILIPYGIWLPILLIVSSLPAVFVVLNINKIRYQWSQKTTTDRRKIQYYELVMTHHGIAAEVRLFNLGSYFQKAYQKLRYKLRTENINLIKQQTGHRVGIAAIALLFSGAALVWMGRKVLLGMITLGDLALFYQAFNKGQNIIKAVVANLSTIYKNSLFLGNLFDFLDIKPVIVDPPHPNTIPQQLKQEIRFNDVSFRYPGCDRFILKNFNLTIPAGKIVAIVGDNGAGKSTLIKLLCRFYDPENGKITLDDRDLRSFSLEELRQAISVLFQLPIHYNLTAEENIALGDLTAKITPREIINAAKAAGIHQKITDLPHGYDTVLGKLFPNGTELSGGEWQRLALARAFLKKAPLIILDEPTSAMDPWAEFDWLERFRKLARNQTSIVITHRFTLAMRADLIYVMRDGKVVESGNHDQLLAYKGLYAESWQQQMSHQSN